MFCSEASSNMLSEVHWRALRVLLNGHGSGFEGLLRIASGVYGYRGGIQALFIEIILCRLDNFLMFRCRILSPKLFGNS